MDVSEHTPRDLFAGAFPLVTEGGEIDTAADLAAGQLLHRPSPDAAWVPTVGGATPTDLSSGEAAVLAQPVAAPDSGNARGQVYLTGVFRGGALAGYEPTDHKAALRRQSLFIKE